MSFAGDRHLVALLHAGAVTRSASPCCGVAGVPDPHHRRATLRHWRSRNEPNRCWARTSSPPAAAPVEAAGDVDVVTAG
ncbi:hypothetical protein KCP70_19860 [Salmonella enterica subsp. enterica]|nr:hypothetical protein KCP70_19860 [Salmonella enterica subsp. enterica]